MKYDFYDRGGAIVPSDTANVIPICNGIYVGGAGNITVRFRPGEALVTFTAVQVGVILPICVCQVMATGTTATLLIAVS